MPPISAVLLLTAAVTAAVLATLVFYIMIGKVNDKLPEDQKIPYFLSFSYSYFQKPTVVRREYKRFYPSGRLHVVRIVLQIIALVLAVAAAKQFSYLWR
jgi:hypothetical protein